MLSIPTTLGKNRSFCTFTASPFITLSVLFAYRPDGWPANFKDGRWRKVEAGRNQIEIAGLHPNQKYDVKALAKYASAGDTIENWNGKEVATETSMCSRSFVQYT